MKTSKKKLLAALLAGFCLSHSGSAGAADSLLTSVSQACHTDSCGEMAACECMDSCETGCGSASGGVCSDGFLFDCDLGDPISLLGDCCDWSAGGWVQMGYHDQNLPLFNSRKNDYQLHQAWFYFENVADGSEGFDWGGRVDYVYGTDSQDTQAFGIANTHWDNQWDNGPDYGHALPQVYGEAAYGDFSVKAGHFYTIIGYEVVTAPDNFFYSHAYTMYNSEPFTHTGVLGTYNHSEDVTVYGGYVLGWDSGFEDNGDAFLGGSSVQLTEDVNLTNTIVAGRFADNSGGDERGIMNSLVASVQLTEKTSWIIQNDLLDTEDRNGQNVRETFGVNQYLVHELSDCVSIGTRFEWWEVEADSPGLFGDNATAAAGTLAGDFDVYAITLGMNLKPHANVIIRPEIRWDWVFGDSGELVAADFSLLDQPFDDDQTTFGIDSIILF